MASSVWITGASSGIGAACARLFAAEGWRVLLSGRDTERLEEVRAGLTQGEHQCFPGDVFEWCEDPKTLPDLGKLDAMVWSAGVCRLASGAMLRARVVEENLRLNLVAPMVVTSQLVKKKAFVDNAQIVWIGSQAAHAAGEGFSIYAAGKGGLASAARVLEREYAGRGIQLHCIEPGTVDTPMTRKLIEDFGGLRGGHEENMESPEAIAKEIYEKIRQQ